MSTAVRPWRVALASAFVSGAALLLGGAFAITRAPQDDERCAGELAPLGPGAYAPSESAFATLPLVGSASCPHDSESTLVAAPIALRREVGPFVVTCSGTRERADRAGRAVILGDAALCSDSVLRVEMPTRADASGGSERHLEIRHDVAKDVYLVRANDGAELVAFQRVHRPRRAPEISRRLLSGVAALAVALVVAVVGLARLHAASRWFRRGGLAFWRRGHLREDGRAEIDGAAAVVQGASDLPPGPALVGPPEATTARPYRALGRVVTVKITEEAYRDARGAESLRVVPGARAAHRAEGHRAANTAAALFLFTLVPVAASLVLGVGPFFARPIVPFVVYAEYPESFEPRPPEPPEAVKLAAGQFHVCALISNGRVRCWGANTAGELGYGDRRYIGNEVIPVDAGDVDVGAQALSIAAGGFRTCAILLDGQTRCWGWGERVLLADGRQMSVGAEVPPSSAAPEKHSPRVIDVALGGYHRCDLFETGELRCWGSVVDGPFGPNDVLPVAGAGDFQVDGHTAQVVAGFSHSCARLEGGEVACWGRGDAGQLGYGNRDDLGGAVPPSRLRAVPVGGRVIELAAGSSHTCALLEGGRVRCWGSNSYGQLGYGDLKSVGDRITPDQAGDVGLDGAALHLAAGGDHTCALLEGGRVRCWGRNTDGQLGYEGRVAGDRVRSAKPGVVDVGGPVEQIVAGYDFTCALLEDRRVRCWGTGVTGVIGRPLRGATHTSGPPAKMDVVHVID